MLELARRLFKTEHDLVQEDLSAYLDDELTKKDRARVERHLPTCADCRADLATLRQTADLLHMLPPVSLPRSFLVPVAEGRLGFAAQRQPMFGALRLASAMATLMFVIVVSGNLWLQTGLGNPSPASPQREAMTLSTEQQDVGILAATEAQPDAMAAKAAVTVETEILNLSVPEIAAQAPVDQETVTVPPISLQREAPRMMVEAPTMQAEMVQAPAEVAAPEMAESLPSATAAVIAAVPAETQPDAEPAGSAAAFSQDANDVFTLDNRDARSREMLRAVLDALMWALLLITVVLWAVTAVLSRPHRYH